VIERAVAAEMRASNNARAGACRDESGLFGDAIESIPATG